MAWRFPMRPRPAQAILSFAARIVTVREAAGDTAYFRHHGSSRQFAALCQSRRTGIEGTIILAFY
jgi:hypothetical protein